MKTYHMYHTESISAESKLKDAEKQEEKQFSKSGDLNVNLLRHEDRQPRRSSVRKIEKMKEKVYIYICLHKFRSVCAVKSWIISFTFRLGKTFKQLMVSQLSLSGVLGNIERWVDQQLDRKSQEHTVGLQPDEYFRPITPLPSILFRFLACEKSSPLHVGLSGACWTLDTPMHFLFCIFVSDFFMQMKFPSSLRCRKSKGCQYGSVSPSSGWYPQRCCLAWKPQTIYNTTWRWICVFFLWMVSTLLSHYSTGKHLEEEDEGMQS